MCVEVLLENGGFVGKGRKIFKNILKFVEPFLLSHVLYTK